MPPFRRFRKKRRFFRKKRFSFNKLAPRRTGGLFGIRRRTIKAESKSLDTALSFNATTTATVTLLNGTTAGTNLNERIGRKIRIKSIGLRVLGNANAAVPTNAICRFMLVMDRQANGSTPSFSDVIQGLNAAGTTTNSVTDYINLNNRGRFNIIWDKVFIVTTTDVGMSFKMFKKKIIDVTYNATTNAASSIATNSLWFIAQSTLATNTPIFIGSVRIRYTDA